MASLEEGADRLRRAAQEFAQLADRLEDGTANRADFNPILAEVVKTQRDHFGPRPRSRRGDGAQRKILDYLQQRVGQVVYGEELGLISDIGEWARRVRELRVERGYDIEEVGASSYRLNSAQPDAQRAARWQKLNSIRKTPGSAKDRLKVMFEEFVGETLTRDDIDYAANIKTGDRRTRALRDEEGWPIATHIDDKTLRVGEYKLVSKDPNDRRDPLQRLYPEGVLAAVFERDNYTCQKCGRDRDRALRAGDKRFYLEAHHLVAVADELAALPKAERNNLDNLITLCHRDHIEETRKLQKAKADQRRKRR